MRPRTSREALRCRSAEANLNDSLFRDSQSEVLLPRQNPSTRAPPPHPGSEGVPRRWDEHNMRLMEHCSEQDVLTA